MDSGGLSHSINSHSSGKELMKEMGSEKYGSSARCATRNKMFNKYASTVGFVWESTIARSANSLMTTCPSISITAINVESAELAVRKTFSIVIDADSHICVERAMHHNCPVCFEVASTPMPEMYQNKMVWILCNDCGETSEVNYHIVAQKCLNCNSYNTKQTRQPDNMLVWNIRDG
ncbi:UNVERIFIED_CONTAM: E3 ubiquitin-protein ligase RZFP34 [Sesamum calycinum]|uniref:E3 ubiquitin-protein ligase RZFP34 n=1 Tax=Sesamum calycinum TaxID=2727403 RepID=A0AAW2N3G6_9LAMI